MFVFFAAMVHRLHEGGVCLADGQTGPAAPHLPAENTHQDREGKQACRQRMRVETRVSALAHRTASVARDERASDRILTKRGAAARRFRLFIVR